MCATQKKYLENAKAAEKAKKEIAGILQNLKDQTGTMVNAIGVKYRGGKVDRIDLKPATA